MSTPSSADRFREEKSDSRRYENQQSPVLRVVRITELGLVFESWRSFEVGLFIDFGMHVPGGDRRDHKPSFLSLEGFVVDCQPVGREGALQVTVMFSDLEAEAREVLQELEWVAGAQPATTSTATSMSRREMMLARLEESFGLN